MIRDEVIRVDRDPKRGKRGKLLIAQGRDTSLPSPHLKAKRAGSFIFATVETIEAPPVFGEFPQKFLEFALRALGSPALSRVLHVCSGSIGPDAGGVRVDIRHEQLPDVVADGRNLPFRDSVFEAALIDPPYCVEYAAELYGTDYPRPSHLLREAARVVRPCGRIGFLHWIVPFPHPGCSIASTTGVTSGTGYRIRAFTVLVKEQAGLALDPEA